MVRGWRQHAGNLGLGDCLEPARLSFAVVRSPRRVARPPDNHEMAVIPNRVSLSLLWRLTYILRNASRWRLCLIKYYILWHVMKNIF